MIEVPGNELRHSEPIRIADDLGSRDFLCLNDFVGSGRNRPVGYSLYSGAGVGDKGYERAGIGVAVHVEIERERIAVGRRNFPMSEWLDGDVRDRLEDVVDVHHERGGTVDLLIATPPCQGMSSSNPSRGKRATPKADALDEKNGLILEVIPYAKALNPRFIVCENVRQILTLTVRRGGRRRKVTDLLTEGLPDYHWFWGVVNVADYGVPQVRRRALMVAVRKDEPCLERLLKEGLLPWPKPTHAEHGDNGHLPWLCVKEWLQSLGHQPLDARSKDTARGDHPLHYVPWYREERYLQISDIPPDTGRSAYENDRCPSCGYQGVAAGLIGCPECGEVMRNRPYVIRDGETRLVKGFKSSYRRMRSDRPSYTITTNTSHVGSDFKIHPWENRVLSPLECADIQTVPRSFDWSYAIESGRKYLVRKLVGEAFPPYFTYQHGLVLRSLLDGDFDDLAERLAPRNPH